MDNELAVVDAEYTETVPAEIASVARLVERGGYQRALTPMNEPIPLGGYEAPNWKAIPPRTPKDEIRPVYDDSGKLLYKSISTGFVVRTLDKVFGGHNWGTEIVEFDTNALSEGRIEYTCALQIVGPGMFRPALGVGSNIYNPKNKQDTKAKSVAGAVTAALKNAAKTMNIGRDFDEDDPEVQKVMSERQKTIAMFIDKLDTKGKSKDAVAVVRKYSPDSILGDTVMVTSIDFEHLEPIQRELAELAAKPTGGA